MFLFCLGIKQAITDGLTAGGPEVQAVAIADDVTFIGPLNGLAATNAVEAFRKTCAISGLTLQGQKGKLLNFSHGILHRDTLVYAKQHRFPIERDAAVILGAPMGSNRAKVQQLALEEISRDDRFFESITP
jgi:hypothetical protein